MNDSSIGQSPDPVEEARKRERAREKHKRDDPTRRRSSEWRDITFTDQSPSDSTSREVIKGALARLRRCCPFLPKDSSDNNVPLSEVAQGGQQGDDTTRVTSIELPLQEVPTQGVPIQEVPRSTQEPSTSPEPLPTVTRPGRHKPLRLPEQGETGNPSNMNTSDATGNVVGPSVRRLPPLPGGGPRNSQTMLIPELTEQERAEQLALRKEIEAQWEKQGPNSPIIRRERAAWEGSEEKYEEAKKAVKEHNTAQGPAQHTYSVEHSSQTSGDATQGLSPLEKTYYLSLLEAGEDLPPGVYPFVKTEGAMVPRDSIPSSPNRPFSETSSPVDTTHHDTNRNRV